MIMIVWYYMTIQVDNAQHCIHMILTYARSQALVLPSALASSGRSAASKAWIRRDLIFYPTTTIPC